jgi:uncharacterized protein YutE (UPF0331/DUF86 family)
VLYDVILNKIATIERCLHRIDEEYAHDKETFLANFTKQDSVILNLERASQATIDIATHLIKIQKLGLPNSSKETFVLLQDVGIICEKSSHNMQAMVGFRNIAVHDYQNLSLEITVSIVENHLGDFGVFVKEVLRFIDKDL